MPRITISIIAPTSTFDGEFITLDLPPGLSVADLKGSVTAETNIPSDKQQFYLNNKVVQGDSKTLEEVGLADGDMMAMLVRPHIQSGGGPGGGSSGSSGGGRVGDPSQARPNPAHAGMRGPSSGGPEEIENTRVNILGNPTAMAQIRHQRPVLAAAINDSNRFREVWMEMVRETENRERERMAQMRLLNGDPFNVDAQKRIEEMIREESVQENLQFAYEHNPEVFGRVTMLYVPVEVNKYPVKAFVDSGAQTTIMSPSCAEACGIMRLIDKRYSGIAKGVGTATILGRVHSADIRVGTATMPCSFTVMEGKDVDLLLGLDMLKRFQGIIDLRANKLVLGEDGNEVPFLGEADIPKHIQEALQSEPTITGPNGTEIGAQSGTVKPVGALAAASSMAVDPSGKTPAFPGQGRTLASAAASQPPSANTPSQPDTQSFPQGSIDQLVNLGFSRTQAVAALEACNGNVEYAAGLLFQG